MDNATKALIIAGGVFIAMMIIGVALYVFTGAREFAQTSNDVASASNVASFNRYYQSFSKDIKGIDALNLYNKAKDDQYKYNNRMSGHNVSIEGNINTYISNLTGDTGVKYMKDNYTYDYYDMNEDLYIDRIVINKK